MFTVGRFTHLYSLHKDAPTIRGFIEAGLHLMGDRLPVGEDVPEVPGAQHVPQGGGGQKLGGARVIIHIGHGTGRVLECQMEIIGDTGRICLADLYFVIHYCIHKDCHAIFCQYLHFES